MVHAGAVGPPARSAQLYSQPAPFDVVSTSVIRARSTAGHDEPAECVTARNL